MTSSCLVSAKTALAKSAMCIYEGILGRKKNEKVSSTVWLLILLKKELHPYYNENLLLFQPIHRWPIALICV